MATPKRPNGADTAEPITTGKSGKGTKRGSRTRGGASKKTADGSNRVRTYPTIRETIRIDHDIVKGTFDRHFDGFRSAFFHVTSILGRFQLEEEAHRVHEYIVQLIDGTKVEIEKATSEIEDLVRSRVSLDSIPRTSNNTVEKEVDIPAYVVRRYMELFPVADRLIDAIVYAETTGVVSWQRRAEMLKNVPKYLRQPAGRFHSLAGKLSARQNRSEKDMQAAKGVMQGVIADLLESHRSLASVDQKRPLTESTGTEG